MKTGMFPSQLEALRREVRAIEKEERERGNRRAFLGGLLGLGAGAASALGLSALLGDSAHADSKPRTSERAQAAPTPAASPEYLRELARGDLDTLITRRGQFFTACEQVEIVDTTVAMGLQRLAHVAIEGKLRDAMATGRPQPLTTKDLVRAATQVRPSTKEWFATAKNYALYSNEAGLYDDILDYLKLR